MSIKQLKHTTGQDPLGMMANRMKSLSLSIISSFFQSGSLAVGNLVENGFEPQFSNTLVPGIHTLGSIGSQMNIHAQSLQKKNGTEQI